MILNLSITIEDDASRFDLFRAFSMLGNKAGFRLEMSGAGDVDNSIELDTSDLPASVTEAVLFRSE